MATSDEMKTKRRLTVVYPPDYDGELHIYVEEDRKTVVPYLKVYFEVGMQPNETPKDTLRRISNDLTRVR